MKHIRRDFFVLHIRFNKIQKLLLRFTNVLLDPCDFAKHRIRYISGRAALNVSSRSLSCLHGRDHHTADKKREDVERQVSIKLYCSSFLLQIS